MEKIRTALCSFGMSGSVFHAPFLEAHPGFDLYATWERSKKTAKEFYPDIISYDSLDEMLHDSSIDLVIVNTPNATHYDFTKRSLLADKHVLVEKPFTVTSIEAVELIKLSKDQNKHLSVYQNRRWDSDFKTVKKVISEGLLGEIVEAEFHFDRYTKELSYKQHKETESPGNGVLYDLGSHLIDAALYLFGKPIAVFADLRIIRPISRVNDYMDMLLYYPTLRVRLKSSYLTREPLPAFILHGSNGSFLKSRADVQEKNLQSGKKPGNDDWGQEPDEERGLLHTSRNDGVIRAKIPSERGNYMEYYERLYRAIRMNEPLPVTADEGKTVIDIIEAALESNTCKKIISLK